MNFRPQDRGSKLSDAPGSILPDTILGLISQAKLAEVADAIYREFPLARTAGTLIGYSSAEAMDHMVEHWHSALLSYCTATDVPRWFRCARAVVLWKAQNVRMLLWRGTHNSHAFLPTLQGAADKCLDVAMRSIHDIALFSHEWPQAAAHQSLSWYAPYFVFQAALVIEAVRLAPGLDGRQSTHGKPEWQLGHSSQEARLCLRRLAESSRPARRSLQVLENINARGALRVHDTTGSSREVRTGARGVTTGVDERLEQHTPRRGDESSSNDYAAAHPHFPPTSDGNPENNFFALADMSTDLTDNIPLEWLFN